MNELIKKLAKAHLVRSEYTECGEQECHKYEFDEVELVEFAKMMAELEQEPVAWMVYTHDGKSVYVTDNPTDIQEGQRALPLYTTSPAGDIRALKHRIHELEGELMGYKKILADQDALLERQTARIVDLQTHIDNFDGENR